MMSANLSYSSICFGVLVTFAAGFVQGFSGFGFAIVFTPFFSLFFGNPQEVVFLAPVLGSFLSVGVMIESRGYIRKRLVAPLFIGTGVGTPVGLLIRASLNMRGLRLIIAAFAILISLLRILSPSIRLEGGYKTLLIGGFVGGLLNGTSSMGGSIPSLLLAFMGLEIKNARAALASFNLLSYFLATALAVIVHVALYSWFLAVLWLLPLASLGSLSGAFLVRYVSQYTFGIFVTAVVGLSGCVGLVSMILGS